MLTTHAISKTALQDVSHPTQPLNDDGIDSVAMKTPTFFSEDWYQPLDNGPTVWSVIRDIWRATLTEAINFFTKKRKRKEQIVDASLQKVVQAKPVYTLNAEGTPTPVWEPSTGKIEHSPFVDQDELDETTINTAKLNKDELRERPLSADELENLEDINAWISANIEEASLSLEVAEEEHATILESIIAIETEVLEVEEMVSSTLLDDSNRVDESSTYDERLAVLPFRVEEDVTLVVETEDNLDVTLVVTTPQEEEIPASGSVITYTDEELERLNQEQNQELNALINGYFSSNR
jgi:hypothetical protein